MSNLLKRSISGFLFLVIMVGGLMSRYCFLAIMLVIMFGASREFIRLTGGERKAVLQQYLAKLAGAVLLGACFLVCACGIDTAWLSLALIPVLLIPLSFIFSGNIAEIDNLHPIYSSLLYICLPVALSPFLVFKAGEYDGTLLLSIFILIWMSDVGAYCIGSLLGQREGARRMSPKISPKKSWWGFWGSIIVSAASSVAVHFLILKDIHILHCIALGVLVPLCCVCGDLVESMWKRHYGVKDSGNAIPGHGGFLDRFDSSLIAIPFAAFYLFLTGII